MLIYQGKSRVYTRHHLAMRYTMFAIKLKQRWLLQMCITLS